MFDTYGPFLLRSEADHVSRESMREFWDEVDDTVSGLSSAMGIYIFVTDNADGLVPHYVGKTEGSFQRRFRQHLQAKDDSVFAKLLDLIVEGQVKIFLLPRITPKKRKFLRVTRKGLKSVKELEFMLIASCIRKNPDLLNIQEKKFHTGLIVPGYQGDDVRKRNRSAELLATLLKCK